MDRPLRIMMVALSLDVGGLERLLIDLVRELRRRGHHVEVCTLQQPGALAPELAREGITITALEKPPGLSLSTVMALRRLILARNIDVVHTHNASAHFFGALAALLCGPSVKLIHTRHGLGDMDNRRAALRNTLCAWLSNFVVPVSADTEKVCREQERCPASRLRTIINGINLSPYLSAPLPDTDNDRSDWHIGHVGRLSPIKHQSMLLHVHARFVEHYPNAQLTLVGDGPSRAALEQLCDQLNLRDHVHFLGYRSDIPELMRTFDWFCLTSLSEGLPLVAIEAMASGRPVVSTAVGGLPEIVRNGDTGFLAESEDIDAMLARWLTLAGEPDALARMGERARQLAVDHYSLARMTSDYEQLYHEALGTRERNQS